MEHTTGVYYRQWVAFVDILKPILTLEENSLVMYIIEQWSMV